MNIADPCIPLSLLPPGSKALVIAEHQDEYHNLPAIITQRGEVISRWSPTVEERAAIVRGEDIFVTILSRGQIHPFYVTIGMVDWSK